MSRQSELAQLGRVFDNSALSNRNLIINGAMQVAQRGTSFSGPNDYTIDRWKAIAIHPVYTVAQQAVTDLAGFSKCIRVQRNVGTATNAYSIEVNQPVESLNTVSVVGKTVTLSFWARVGSDYSGDVDAFTSTIAYHNLTGSSMGMEEGRFFAEFATTKVVQANTPNTDWTYYTMTADIASDAYQVGVVISTQSWTGTAGANDYFEVTGVQLEVGDTATPFEHRSYGQELALCQRYYQTLAYLNGLVYNSTTVSATVNYPIMRANPTFSASGPLNFQGTAANNSIQSSANLGTAYTYNKTSTYFVNVLNFSSLTANQPGYLAVPASNSNFIIADAEL